MDQSQNPVIIGAGPAGLTAALKLVERGVKPRIFESSGEVGGLARTGGRGDQKRPADPAVRLCERPPLPCAQALVGEG